MDPVFIRGAAGALTQAGGPLIFGLRMRPLTLGHQFLLLSLQSPLLDVDQPMTEGDFLSAIFICSQDWRAAERSLTRRWLPWFFKLWAWRNRGVESTAECQRFLEWYAAQVTGAEFRQPTGAATAGAGPVSRSCGAPASYVRLVFLVTVLHMSYEEALDIPVATASALYAAWLDWDGRAQLVSDEDREFWAAAAAEDAKRFNADGTRKEVRGGELSVEGKEVGKSA